MSSLIDSGIIKPPSDARYCEQHNTHLGVRLIDIENNYIHITLEHGVYKQNYYNQ